MLRLHTPLGVLQLVAGVPWHTTPSSAYHTSGSSGGCPVIHSGGCPVMMPCLRPAVTPVICSTGLAAVSVMHRSWNQQPRASMLAQTSLSAVRPQRCGRRCPCICAARDRKCGPTAATPRVISSANLYGTPGKGGLIDSKGGKFLKVGVRLSYPNVASLRTRTMYSSVLQGQHSWIYLGLAVHPTSPAQRHQGI